MIVRCCAAILVAHSADIQAAHTAPLLSGARAFGDWRDDAPGVRRKITIASLPPPFATESAGNGPRIVPRPAGVQLKVPSGFVVDEFATGLETPRELRVAPNGDLFVAESYAGRIRVMRAAEGATGVHRAEIFASGLTLPFGMAFWPPGPHPQFLYVANTDSVVRFPTAMVTWQPAAQCRRSYRASPAAAISAAVATGPAISSSRPTVPGCSSRSAR